MKKIILASGSPQRKKLLSSLGVKFLIKPSQVEEITEMKSTPSKLVMDNALLKAADIAQRYNDALIIGADTIVYGGNKKMIGKPKDAKEAKSTLRKLSEKPHWVYTGLILIDTKTKKQVIDYEKTKVFMHRLSEKEMNQYHKKVNPYDKAGGFDIEGWGSSFIYRIEGCYTNVIGLPLAKISKMFKKFGVSILSMILLIMVQGCTSEFNLATGKEETLMYSTDREVKIGQKVSASLEKHYSLVEDVDVNERLKSISDRILVHSDRKDIVFFVKVIDEPEVFNAVSLPGGYIYFFKGLYDKLETDDQIAGVLAHEMGHITARHSVKRLQASYGAMLAQIAAIEAGGGEFAAGVNLALSSAFSEYSQSDEFEADKLAVKYMKKAGFNPQGMMEVVELFKKEQERAPIRKYHYWRTHPHLHKRSAIIAQEISGEIEFEHYLNLAE